MRAKKHFPIAKNIHFYKAGTTKTMFKEALQVERKWYQMDR
jgi:hypothetical protein